MLTLIRNSVLAHLSYPRGRSKSQRETQNPRYTPGAAQIKGPLGSSWQKRGERVEANAFIGKTTKPTGEELAAELGPAKAVWDLFIAELADENGVNLQEWSSYSPKAGWSLRLKRKKRTIVWLAPCQGCFRVAFILGDKAMKAARECGFPQRIVKILEEAPKYPEGTGVRLAIKAARDIAVLKKLAAIKLRN